MYEGRCRVPSIRISAQCLLLSSSRLPSEKKGESHWPLLKFVLSQGWPKGGRGQTFDQKITQWTRLWIKLKKRKRLTVAAMKSSSVGGAISAGSEFERRWINTSQRKTNDKVHGEPAKTNVRITKLSINNDEHKMQWKTKFWLILRSFCTCEKGSVFFRECGRKCHRPTCSGFGSYKTMGTVFPILVGCSH